jgi:hypothetical protein
MSKLQAAAPRCEGKQKMTTGELHWVALGVFVALLLFVTGAWVCRGALDGW